MPPHRHATDHVKAEWLIEDPGDAGAIAAGKSGVCNLVSGASAETRTLANPVEFGQELTLAMKTDGGGDITVTAAGALGVTGNNTIVFSNAGDCLFLKAVDIGGTLLWRAFGVVTGTATVESTPVLSTV